MQLTEEQKAARRAYHVAHRDEIRARKKRYYAENRASILAKAKAYFQSEHGNRMAKLHKIRTADRVRELDRARYRRHRERRLAANKEWRQRNRATLKIKAAARAKADRIAHPEKFLIRNREDRKKHSEKRRATQRNWQRANRDKGRAYEAKYLSDKPWVRVMKNNRRRVRKLNAITDNSAAEFIKKTRSTESLPCSYCGRVISGITAHIDHIVPLFRGGTHTSDNLCAACVFCNCSKGVKLLSEWVPPIRQPVLSIGKEVQVG